MATTTTNFGWDIPQSTDLVKDGATAIAALGQDIDTALVDLKGGTTGQVLAKASGTDLDFSWVAQDDSNAIQNAIVDAKGDLIAATANDTPARLAVGTNGQVLTANSGAATGLAWATPASGALTLISTTSFSNVASQAFDNVFTSTYSSYIAVINNISSVTAQDDLHLQMRYAGPTTQASTYYAASIYGDYTGVTPTVAGSNNASQAIVGQAIGTNSSGEIWFASVGNTSEKASFRGVYVDTTNGAVNPFGGKVDTARTYTGFLLKSANTNITGSVSIYGLAK